MVDKQIFACVPSVYVISPIIHPSYYHTVKRMGNAIVSVMSVILFTDWGRLHTGDPSPPILQWDTLQGVPYSDRQEDLLLSSFYHSFSSFHHTFFYLLSICLIFSLYYSSLIFPTFIFPFTIFLLCHA